MLFILFVLVGASSASNVSRENLSFGYCAGAVAHMGKGNYIEEIADHNNTAWVRGPADMDHPDVYDKMAQAKRHGMKLLIDISAVLFSDQFRLLPDYQARWDTYAERVRPYIDNVAAFYPLDEPYLWSKRGYLTEKEMKAQLDLIGPMIHKTFPAAKVAMVFTARDLYQKNPDIFPISFDWFGFDCFGSWNNCQGNPIPFYFDRIKAQLKRDQKIILIPDATIMHYDSAPVSEIEQKQLIDRLDQYWDMAKKDPIVVGFYPFLFQSYIEEGYKYFNGVETMPLVLDRMRVISKEVNFLNRSNLNPSIKSKPSR